MAEPIKIVIQDDVPEFAIRVRIEPARSDARRPAGHERTSAPAPAPERTSPRETAAPEELPERKRKPAGEKKESDADSKRSAAGAAVGGAVGRRAGAAIGAAVGGPVGAAVGGVIGGVVGSKLGSKIASKGSGGKEEGDSEEGGKLAAVGVVADQTQKALKLVGAAARFTGEAFERVAGNDGVGLIAQASEQVAGALDEIPVVGKAAGEALRTFTTVMTVTNRVMGAFAERGRELSGYNGSIAGAAARQDVTRLMSDIREAQQLGDKYAKLLDKQSEFEEVVKAALLPLKELALDNLPAFINFMMSAITEIVKIGYAIPGVSDEKVKKVVDDISAIRAKAEKPDGGGDLLATWFGPLLNGGLSGPAAPTFDPGENRAPALAGF